MSRPYRIEFPGAIYHVTSRGNNRQPIVIDDQDRQLFLSLLRRTTEHFGIDLFAFCLMDNHYHLFLRTPQPNLHLALQWLGANYTRAFNRRNERDGHLFKSRYHSVLVDDTAHWLHLSAYIHLNPVRAGLVADPADWQWSSARDYLTARVRYSWLQPGPVLASYGSTEVERHRSYRHHLAELSGLPDTTWNDFRDSVFLGTGERWKEMKQAHPPTGRTASVTNLIISQQVQLDLVEELSRMAASLKTTVNHLSRPMVYYHLVRNVGITGSMVADFFNVSEAAVSMGIRRLEQRMVNDKLLQGKVSELNT